jgi:lysyl-tRNA synthetase class 2
LRFRSPHHETQFQLSLVMFTVVGIAVACYLLLRAAEPSPRRTCADDQVIEALLARHGDRDSLGYFARRTDKSVVTSTSGKAALTYRVIAGTALVSADPLGDPEAWPGAVTNFLELCRYNSWVPAVLGCSAQAAQTFARHGMSVLEIGDEAVVTVAEFSLDGRAMRNVRQMVNRVRRLGYTADVRRIGDLTSTEKAELERLATAWRGRHVERGYSMAFGRFGGPDCVVVVASTVDPDGVGNVRALLQFVPWGVDGWSLDLMRRDPAADPGMNDFLIVSALAEAHRFGVRRVSLNFAMLRQAFAQGERLGAGWAARSWAAVLRRLSRWYQLDSLYRFNAKFGPTWVPRYLCYRGAASLPRVAYAAMEAEAFVRRAPGLRRLVGNTVVEGNRSVPTSRASSEVQQKAGV